MEKTQKVFVNGLISKEVRSDAPDFILGKLSIKSEELIAFLVQAKKYEVDGWLNATILKSKGGKRYIELDTWKPKNKEPEYVPDPELVDEIEKAKKAQQMDKDIDSLPDVLF